MSNTVKLTITHKEEDENGNVLNKYTNLTSDTYTAKSSSSFTLPANSAYKSIAFGQVTTAAVVVLVSDQNLTVKINGGSEEFTLSGNVFRGSITSLDVKNENDSDAEITIEVYGS